MTVERMVKHWEEELGLAESEVDLLTRFSRWMHRNSFWLRSVERTGDGLRVEYTDEAERLSFSWRELRREWQRMEDGHPVDWPEWRQTYRVEPDRDPS